MFHSQVRIANEAFWEHLKKLLESNPNLSSRAMSDILMCSNATVLRTMRKRKEEVNKIKEEYKEKMKAKKENNNLKNHD